MHPIHRTRRLGRTLAALAGSLLALAAAAPAALAVGTPPRSGPAPAPRTQTPTPIPGGMPGWQITLIALAAAVVAAAAAVLIYRARAARQHATVPTI